MEFFLKFFFFLKIFFFEKIKKFALDDKKIYGGDEFAQKAEDQWWN